MKFLGLASRLFKRKKNEVAITSEVIARDDQVDFKNIEDNYNDDLHRYPPFAKGFPLINVDKMMLDQIVLINQLKISLPLDKDEYESIFLPVLRRYAAFVHLLPASETHHHKGSGGLWRHGLEVAYFASQSSRVTKFERLAVNVPPRYRNILQQKWHVGTVLAALIHDIGKPVSDVIVSGDSNGNVSVWDNEDSLLKWAHDNNVKRYFISWVPNRHKEHHGVTDAGSRLILTTVARQWLKEFNGKIIRDLNYSLTSPYDQSALMNQMVAKADGKSTDFDTRVTAKMPVFGVPMHEFILDTMRSLITNSEWEVNKPNGKVWVIEGEEGVFVSWYEASKDIVSYMKNANLPPIYQNADSLAMVLLEHELAEYCNLENNSIDSADEVDEATGEIKEGLFGDERKFSKEHMYWKIGPECLNGAALYMLRLNHFNLIDSTHPPEPIPAVFYSITEEGEDIQVYRESKSSNDLKSYKEDLGISLSKGSDDHDNAQDYSAMDADYDDEPPTDYQETEESLKEKEDISSISDSLDVLSHLDIESSKDELSDEENINISSDGDFVFVAEGTSNSVSKEIINSQRKEKEKEKESLIKADHDHELEPKKDNSVTSIDEETLVSVNVNDDSGVNKPLDKYSLAVEYFKEKGHLGELIIRTAESTPELIISVSSKVGFKQVDESSDDYSELLSLIVSNKWIEVDRLKPMLKTKFIGGHVLFLLKSEYADYLLDLLSSKSSENDYKDKPISEKDIPKEVISGSSPVLPVSVDHNSSKGLIEIPKPDLEKLNQTRQKIKDNGVFSVNNEAKNKNNSDHQVKRSKPEPSLSLEQESEENEKIINKIISDLIVSPGKYMGEVDSSGDGLLSVERRGFEEYCLSKTVGNVPGGVSAYIISSPKYSKLRQAHYFFKTR